MAAPAALARYHLAVVPAVRLVFTSDLHLEHQPEVAELVAARARHLGADILVIAGDLGGHGQVVHAGLAALAQGAPHVAFVPGNHDLWCTPAAHLERPDTSPDDALDSRARYLERWPAWCARAGVRYLPSGPLDACGVTLLGQTGWYDYSLRDRRADHAIPREAYVRGRYERLGWADKHLVRWPDLDDAGLTRFMDARLVADLAAAPRDRPAVVVTHMLPFDALCAFRPLPWSFVRGFLGARSTGAAILDAVGAGLPVAQVIAGHSHFARRTAVRAHGRVVPCALAPIGTPRERARMGIGTLAELVAHRLRVVELAAPAHTRARRALASAA